jgi:polysaccharide biosynthesis/export protein
MMKVLYVPVVCVAFCAVLAVPAVGAQDGGGTTPGQGRAPAGMRVPPEDYVIGVDDVISVVFWRETEMSVDDVVVRPDGRISLPLLNDVQAAGFTPEQLGSVLQSTAARYVAEPSATVIVRQINSRRVHVIGEVARPGAVSLTSRMNVLQIIGEVGGLLAYANRSDIAILRVVNGREQRYRFNYNDVVRGRGLQQNIVLQPGDVVVVR